MLRQGTTEQIQNMFTEMRRGVNRMVKELVEITYFMRGGLQYDLAFDLTPGERDIISEFIQARLKSEQERPNPVY